MKLSNFHILDPSIIVASIRWDIMTDTENAQQPPMVPTDCPAAKLFVPYDSVIYLIASINSLPMDPSAFPESNMLHYYCILIILMMYINDKP